MNIYGNVNLNPSFLTNYGKHTQPNPFFQGKQQNILQSVPAAQNNQNSLYTGGIVDMSCSYADSLRESRMKAKETSLQLKKLHYDFKSISTQILRSKTSMNAKQVASKAQREVIRLKSKRNSNEYDSEELESAILHAQAMERVAKKKARHLQEEEMMKVTGGPCEAELEEREDAKNAPKEEALEDALAQQMAAQEKGAQGLSAEQAQDFARLGGLSAQELQEKMEMELAQLAEMMELQTQQMQESFAQPEDMMSELMDEMAESMEELLEDSGLADLAESMFETAEVEMDPADFKMMKIKHRSEELKAIAKADAEYLKAYFDRLEKAKESGGAGIAGAGGASAAGGSLFGGGSGMGGGSFMPDAAAGVSLSVSVPAVSGGIDISV